MLFRRFQLPVSVVAMALNLMGCLTSLSAVTPAPLTIDLDGRPLSESPNAVVPRYGLMKGITDVKQPVLELRRSKSSPSRGTILLFPGGGYHALAFEHEGELVAQFLNEQGYDVAILEYSIGEGEGIRAKALEDARKAVRLLKDDARSLGLDASSLSVMGFSAGGHLAARLLHELGSGAPFDRVILIYPAYLEDSPSGKGIAPDVAPPSGFSGRFFVLIGDHDRPEWVGGARAYGDVAESRGAQVTWHLLPDTGHGFGMKSDLKGASAGWSVLLGEFLER